MAPNIKQLREKYRQLREQLAQVEAIPGVLTDFERARREAAERKRIKEQLPTLLQSLDKSLYVKLSGRQFKILGDQAARYSLPLNDAKVDLFKLLHRFHDILAEYGEKLFDLEDDGGDDSGDIWKQRITKERAKMARMERLQMQGALLPRNTIHQFLAVAASVIRSTGDKLQRAGNVDGFEALNEAVEALQKQIDSLLNAGEELTTDGDLDDAPPPPPAE